MDSSSHKYYHVHEFEPTHLVDLYFSSKSEDALLEETVFATLKFLLNEKQNSRIEGEALLDFSAGSIVFQLLAIFECFKEITLLEFNDFCIAELEKWRNSHDEAYDWSHASKALMDLEGKSGGWQEKEELLKAKIKQILKCDFTKENPTDPIVLPKVDCIISAWLLDIISPDKEAYIRNFRKLSSLLKPGGRLILFGNINHSFYFIGEHKYNFLSYDEEFLRRTLKDEGYVMESYQANDRKTTSPLVDHEKVVFVNAIKKK
ncbi:nicotinamide N-methyltransferase-like [Spea bombifrons]|uniref:nicotinamide N-methyltransferase-like n=1 Tax=Spea bombifrons TaxID=233779 RepID=UPI00234ADE13|nr:nicotinamide N-methyltransferase-like [Spea bombifrons]